MFVPAGLHGIEASFQAEDSLRKLRTAVFRVVWSWRQPLACVGAVLSLLDGSGSEDPAFCVMFLLFGCSGGYLAYRPGEVARVCRLLDTVAEGCPGHGPVHLLLDSATQVGFRWNSLELGWERPGLPVLNNLAGPVQNFREAVLGAWGDKVAADLCGRRVFGMALFWIIVALCSSLTLTMFGREIRRCFVESWLGVWNGVLVGKVRMFLVGFVVVLMGTAICFGACPYPPLVE